MAGFFIGLIISLLKFDAPEIIILWTMISTIIIYLIALCVASFCMKFIDYNEKKMNVKKLDSRLDYYLKEFERREKETLTIRKYLKHNLSAMSEE